MSAVLRFDTITAFLESVGEHGSHVREVAYRDRRYVPEMCAGVDFKTARELAANGSVTFGEAQELSLANNITGSMALSTQVHVAGTGVSVPHYLAGAPKCMRRRVQVERAARHVSIYVSTACAWSWSGEELLGRGRAILSLLSWLQSNRVECDIQLVTGLHHSKDLYSCVRLETRPLDLSQVGFALAHPAFERQLAWQLAYNQGWDGINWAPSERDPKKMRQILGMAAGDVYVQPAEKDCRLMADPKRWLLERVTQLSKGEGL